jgi:hypothetical protein
MPFSSLPVRQCALQCAAVFLAFSIAWPFYYLRAADWHWPTVAALCGAIAFLIAHFSRQVWWWQLIHLLFVPALWAGLQLRVSPLWHLGAFCLLFLIFRGALSERVPLYLSGGATARQLAGVLPRGAQTLDIGAGLGSLLLPLAGLRPDLALSGVENAPLPWLIGYLRTRRSGVAWRWGSFWTLSLARWQVVYCFLSPTPMRALWEKACREMTGGSLFISKAFPVAGVLPEVIFPAEAARDILYLYRIPPRA